MHTLYDRIHILKLKLSITLILVSVFGCTTKLKDNNTMSIGSLVVNVSMKENGSKGRFTARLKWDRNQNRMEVTLLSPDGREKAGYFLLNDKIADINFETRKIRIYKMASDLTVGISAYLSDASLVSARLLLGDPVTRRFPAVGKIVSRKTTEKLTTTKFLSTNGREWMEVELNEDKESGLPLSVTERRSDSKGEAIWHYRKQEMSWNDWSNWPEMSELEEVSDLDQLYNNLFIVRAIHELLIWK